LLAESINLFFLWKHCWRLQSETGTFPKDLSLEPDAFLRIPTQIFWIKSTIQIPSMPLLLLFD